MKYSQKLANKIVDMVSSGEFTIQDICKHVGINKTTFYDWKESKPNFSNSLKKAEEERLESFGKMARSGLAKLLDVYEYEEKTTEYVDNGLGQPKVKNSKVVKKRVMPNATAVIFTLTNLDTENFRHKREIDHTTNGKDMLQSLPDEELKNKIASLLSKLK